MKKVVLSGIKVTGFSGPLLSVHNVDGTGLEGAAQIDAPQSARCGYRHPRCPTG